MSKKMKWPLRKDVERILDELEKIEGSLHLNSDASALEKFRYQLCQRLLGYKIDKNLKQRELADLLSVDESVVSKILHYRIEKISTDKLIEYVQIVEPSLTLLVA